MGGVHDMGRLANFGPVRAETNEAASGDPLHPTRGYCESWLAAIVATLAQTQFLDAARAS